jgi:hypothetical protein
MHYQHEDFMTSHGACACLGFKSACLGDDRVGPVYIARSTAVAARAIGGEMMIMSAKDSTLFTLNPIGTVIWQSADGRTPLEEIIRQKICMEFDVDPVDATKDAESFVNGLAGHGIVLVSSEPIDVAIQGVAP